MENCFLKKIIDYNKLNNNNIIWMFFLNFERGPWVPLLNSAGRKRGPWVQLLNFEGGCRGPGPTYTPFSANPTKWSYTIKQFVVQNRRTV